MSYNTLRFVRACMLASVAGGAVIGMSEPALAQTPKDPGARSLTAAQLANNAASPLTAQSLSAFGLTLDANTQAFFTGGTNIFQEVDDVAAGLGPRFNSNSCSSCHAFPIVGGSSPPFNQFGFTGNPQVAFANANNTIPSFITANGPVREARFVFNPDRSLDGGVHDLFTITGRSDAQGCRIAQPNFAQQVANTNVIFRIPTPTFGLGLVESVSDAGLVAAANGQAALRAHLGISGDFNRSGNDGTITRFGWKAQNKSLLIFSGEAYNVEQGVTNEAFQNERDDTAGCRLNPLPESITPVVARTPSSGSAASDFGSDIINFSAFMRLSSPPQPATPFNASQSRGQTVFLNIGCGACHIQNQTTSTLGFTNISATGAVIPQPPVTFQPFSDFETHGMGGGLADGIFQGNADGDHFRSAPLWGVGQRVFFLHDGRTNDLLQAILAHVTPTPSPQTNAVIATAQNDTDRDIGRSEASQVINNFRALSPTDQQNLLNFLRAL